MNIVNSKPSIELGSPLVFKQKATKFIIKMLDSKKDSNPVPIGIRIFIKKAGCMGGKYCMEYIYNQQLNSIKIECRFLDKVAFVFIDKHDLLSILGTEVDYEETSIKSGFVFKNPNEKSKCGCGESFSV